jgi:hypothetical protein
VSHSSHQHDADGHPPSVRHEDQITLEDAAGFSRTLVLVGALALGAAVALGLGDIAKLQRAYLVAFMYVLSIALGMLWFVAIQHLTNAKWSVVVRRVAELMASNIPLMALLSLGVVIPMLAGSSDVYVWIDRARVEHDHLLHHKAAYLNMPFFCVRWLIYFGFWGWFARRFFRLSVIQDREGGARSARRCSGSARPA